MSARYQTPLLVDVKVEEQKFEEKNRKIYVLRSMKM